MSWNRRSWRVAGGILLSGLLAFATPTKSPVPGTLNYLEGQASLNGMVLNSSSIGNQVVQPGEVVDTQNGKVEMLLTPGVFLRLGENSEARMVSSGLADVEVALDRGQATVEADWWTKDNRLTIDQNIGTRTEILKKGLYVLNAEQPFTQVLDGKAKVLYNDQSVNVGKDREAVLTASGKLKAQDFDSKALKETALVRWSGLRSEYEAQANLDAARTVIVNNGWYGPGWYWGPGFGYWTFLPADGFFYNPFGWGFYSPVYFAYGGVVGRPGFYGHGVYGHGYYGARGGAVFAGPRGGGFAAGARSFGGAHGFGGGGRR